MHRFCLFGTLLLVLSASCSKPPTAPSSGGISSRPLAAPSSGGGETLFTRLDPQSTGVDFANRLVDPSTHPLRRLYASSMVVGGVAVGDVDGDERPDLFFANGPESNRLYRQTGNFTFEDITASAKVDGGTHWGVGVAMVDIDNDGDLDIYVCNHGTPNQLFINNGQAVFAEEAKVWGLDLIEASHTPAFCDYDLDGHLDLYLLTNKYYHPDGKLPDNAPVAMVRDGKIALRPEYEKYVRITGVDHVEGSNPVVHWEDWGRPDYLFRNNGNGKFSDVTKQVGISTSGWGLSAIWWDYNDDGYPDLYVGNDFNSPDALHRNNGDGTFTDIIEEMVPHTPWFSMGADFGDLNADGHFDLLVADMSGTNHYKQKTAMGAMGASAEFLATAVPRQYMRNTLYIGTGRGRFMEGAYMTHLAKSDWTWTVRFSDLDNDGWEDVFITNGMSKNYNDSDNPDAVEVKVGETQWDRHMRAGTPELREQNLAFHNQGDFKFEDVSKAWGLDHTGMSFASVNADLDRDGDLDLVVSNLEEPVHIYRNDGEGGARMLVELRGSASNPRGLGARIAVEAGGRLQKRQLIDMRGYMGSHEAIMHVGLGDAEKVDRLHIDWPSGHQQSFTDLEPNRHYVITEPGGPAPARPRARVLPEPYFVPTQGVAFIRHTENVYDDFADQPLLPNKLSQNGPGLAVGDVDGDGDEDLLLGGAQASAPTLALNDGKGNYAPVTDPARAGDIAVHNGPEDMGALFFDADGDGDLDLYIASGGAEFKPGSKYEPLLQDRLYLNDGQGRFSISPQGLPPMRSANGPVVAADIDRDGDLDLFVGGRNVPGAYPTGPESALLVNEGGRFANATERLGPELKLQGMVTGALFSDVDGDGWMDLLVTREFGPVGYFRNEGGRFVEQTEAAGLAPYSGWWNSIASADFDGDGDMDYVALNFGLNTKYHASLEKPTLIYYGDFENNGTKSIVEAEYEDETLFPVRGRSCSSNAMPHLFDKFKTYHDFALAELDDIYEPNKLDQALRLEATTLESGLFFNEGGKFRFQPLPRVAQVAPGFGVVATEIDGDGHPDLYLVQNTYAPQVETGHMAGGVSLLLLGRGDGGFAAVWPEESGLVVPGDAKSLAVTDWNGDAKPDFLIGNNNDQMSAFENRMNGNRFLAVKLQGKAGNPSAVGARVTLETADGKRQTAEVAAGSGYLSQSTAALGFGLGEQGRVAKITVRWPDGAETRHDGEAMGSAEVITLRQSGADQ